MLLHTCLYQAASGDAASLWALGVPAELAAVQVTSYDRLFFLAYAQAWCSKTTSQAERIQVPMQACARVCVWVCVRVRFANHSCLTPSSEHACGAARRPSPTRTRRPLRGSWARSKTLPSLPRRGSAPQAPA